MRVRSLVRALLRLFIIIMMDDDNDDDDDDDDNDKIDDNYSNFTGDIPRSPGSAIRSANCCVSKIYDDVQFWSYSVYVRG